jgi:hypothetical protein
MYSLVHDEWKRIWKQVTTTHYNVPSQHLHGHTTENDEKLQLGELACEIRTESTTSLIQNRSTSHLITMFKLKI